MYQPGQQIHWEVVQYRWTRHWCPEMPGGRGTWTHQPILSPGWGGLLGRSYRLLCAFAASAGQSRPLQSHAPALSCFMFKGEENAGCVLVAPMPSLIMSLTGLAEDSLPVPVGGWIALRI